jgi:hypothetical protein
MAKKSWEYMIENVPHKSEVQIVTGADVRAVPPGIPDTMDLYVKIRGNPGKLVKNDDKVDLDEPGIEKFYAQDASSEAGHS